MNRSYSLARFTRRFADATLRQIGGEMIHDKFFEDCVITIVADDYENFDLILKWSRRLALARNFSVMKAQVVDALKRSISHGYVEVWELSPKAPARRGKFSLGRLHNMWFYASEKGKRAAKGIPILSGGRL
jgi:hypothetical protein